MKIVVGSKNPVKVNATKNAFEKMRPEVDFEFVWIDVPSEVPDQPVGHHQTKLGAFNRANNAKQIQFDWDYFVGLEGWIVEDEHWMNTFAWMCVMDKNWKIGFWQTASFYLPEKVRKLVNDWMELGHADDVVFANRLNWATNSKQGLWAMGLLTFWVVDRTALYEMWVLWALIPFKNPEFYS